MKHLKSVLHLDQEFSGLIVGSLVKKIISKSLKSAKRQRREVQTTNKESVEFERFLPYFGFMVLRYRECQGLCISCDKGFP